MKISSIMLRFLSLSCTWFYFLLNSSGNNMLGGQQPQKHYGITSSISLAFPRDIDHLYTQKLMEAMKPFGVFEDEDELNHR